MKAIVYQRYGSPDVLHCEEVEKPSPGDDEALIRIRAATGMLREIALEARRISAVIRLGARFELPLLR